MEDSMHKVTVTASNLAVMSISEHKHRMSATSKAPKPALVIGIGSRSNATSLATPCYLFILSPLLVGVWAFIGLTTSIITRMLPTTTRASGVLLPIKFSLSAGDSSCKKQLQQMIQGSQEPACHMNDLTALKGFAKFLKPDIGGWNWSSCNCCSFTGITCDNSSDIYGRLVGLELGNKRLTGTICESL
ncbi:hypothetical protein Goklo_016844, partial [Gossypium klotzschianum]|nr:hypothetical protein [Gossypium klotzschianum]